MHVNSPNSTAVETVPEAEPVVQPVLQPAGWLVVLLAALPSITCFPVLSRVSPVKNVLKSGYRYFTARTGCQTGRADHRRMRKTMTC